MFIVASDLSEAQRERLTSSLSLQKMNVTAYTFDAVNTVFVKLFCTPKSSMENPSLRVSGHGNSMNRTFIVEECAEDEFGQWAIDGVTGGQGYFDAERSCFWRWDDNEHAWQSRPFKGRQVKAKKKQTQRQRQKWIQKEPEQYSSVVNEHRILNGGQKKTWFVGPEERKAKACRMAMKASRRAVFALTSQKKGAGKDFILHKGRGKDPKKKRARKPLIHNREFQHLKHPMKKDMAMLGKRTTGLPAIALTSPQLHLLGIQLMLFSILAAHDRFDHEQQSNVLRIMHGIEALRRSFAVATTLLFAQNSEIETCLASCIIHFPTTPPCSTRVDVLETGVVPI